MSLEEEIRRAQKTIVRDNLDMSFGELINIYQEKEIYINPEFQRLFRWDETQKTRFIESLLLNIPIPPIFVFTRDDGKWELIDGLQRLSTVLQFVGKLRKNDASDELFDPYFSCSGTNMLPSLDGKHWPKEGTDEDQNTLTSGQQIQIKRAKIRIEILSKMSDVQAKFELFQRLNTGGSSLVPQEIRNCMISSINPTFYRYIKDLSLNPDFVSTLALSESRKDQSADLELIIRFLAYRNHPYEGRLDINEYLDKATVQLCEDKDFDFDREKVIFDKTFALLNQAAGNNAFKRRSGNFSIAAYEFATLGLSKYLETNTTASDWVKSKLDAMEMLPDFETYTAAGITGPRRLSKLIFSQAKEFFADGKQNTN